MRKALLIGINNYGVPYSLNGCVNDMNAVAELLRTNEDGSPNFDVQTEPDCHNSGIARKRIQQLFANNDDIALLYFSGHGHLGDNDGEIVFPQDIQNAGAYIGLRMSDILQIANDSPVRNKIIILDCCHSGDMGSPISGKFSTISSGVSIMTACRNTESAMEVNGHGLFTEQLCNALSGGASDFSGNITIGGIYAFIDRTFGVWQQRPTFKTNVTQFVPIRKVVPQVDLNVLRQLTSLFCTQDMTFPLDPSYEYTNTKELEHKAIKPYADKDNIDKFKLPQQLESIGMVEPIGSTHMYFAAMESKACKLTRIGQYYWELVKTNKI